MPDVPAEPADREPAGPVPAGSGRADDGPAGTGPAGTARADDGPAGGQPPPRSPGWREVGAIAALILLAVFAVELSSALLPPIREAFRGLPVTILVLVVGTVGLLGLIAARRPRP